MRTSLKLTRQMVHYVPRESRLWAPRNRALGSLKKAVTAVAVIRPPQMEQFADAVYKAALSKADAMRLPSMEFEERLSAFRQGIRLLDEARRDFTAAARECCRAHRTRGALRLVERLWAGAAMGREIGARKLARDSGRLWTCPR